MYLMLMTPLPWLLIAMAVVDPISRANFVLSPTIATKSSSRPHHTIDQCFALPSCPTQIVNIEQTALPFTPKASMLASNPRTPLNP